MFKPYNNQVLIEPIIQTSMLSETKPPEMGTVVTVGNKVSFVKKGDTIYFRSWGMSETPEIGGKKYTLVECTPEFVLGKENARKK